MAATTLAHNFAILKSPPNIIRGQKNSAHEFPKTFSHSSHQLDHIYHKRHRICSAAISSSTSSITEYDLYDLLGIDSSSDQTEIKKAYRSLQKKCHPDIAGTAGHDMAIILNEAYAVLSDPISRYVYDKEQAKATELKGYTGRPMYSVWQGPETEQRAIFVDEVRCIGCLKCALFADKTFAIESNYGRARVVAQWADPEDKIQASIDTCPINCISVVERSDLAALEFLMSKQPRGRVRIGADNTAGARSFDVLSELKVFHKRLEEAAIKKSQQDSKYSEDQRDARQSAMQTIRSISNWLYWRSPPSDYSSSNLTVTRKNISSDPHIKKLREAASQARKNGILNTKNSAKALPQATSKDEYWVPLTPTLPPEAGGESISQTSKPSTKKARKNNRDYNKRDKRQGNRVLSGIPIGLGVGAAITVGLNGAGEAVGGLEGHIAGSFVQQIVNSFGLQVTLAGVTWYLIGLYVMQVVESVTRRDEL